jgi:uncharacterized protein YerC
VVDRSRIAALRAQGRSWAQIKDEVGVSKGTAHRALMRLPKIGSRSLGSSPMAEAIQKQTRIELALHDAL